MQKCELGGWAYLKGSWGVIGRGILKIEGRWYTNGTENNNPRCLSFASEGDYLPSLEWVGLGGRLLKDLRDTKKEASFR